jgi:hypothetical protein
MVAVQVMQGLWMPEGCVCVVLCDIVETSRVHIVGWNRSWQP